MRLLLRNDIPLHASTLGYLNKLAEITITKPLVFLTGPNGSGKSLILEAMRTAMHKTGYGFGTELADNGFNGYPIFSRRWQEHPANKKAGVDLAFMRWRGLMIFTDGGRLKRSLSSPTAMGCWILMP